MTCHAMLRCCLGLGLDLMHLLGWVSIHDTHQHMEVLKKNFVVVIFGVWIFGLLHAQSDGILEHAVDEIKFGNYSH